MADLLPSLMRHQCTMVASTQVLAHHLPYYHTPVAGTSVHTAIHPMTIVRTPVPPRVSYIYFRGWTSHTRDFVRCLGQIVRPSVVPSRTSILLTTRTTRAATQQSTVTTKATTWTDNIIAYVQIVSSERSQRHIIRTRSDDPSGTSTFAKITPSLPS
jgi:hypothetical protein